MDPNKFIIALNPRSLDRDCPEPSIGNAGALIGELLDDLLTGAPKSGFTVKLKPTGDPFSNGWNAAMQYVREHSAPAPLPQPINVIFNGPATIVYWNDGTKTVVKCQPGDVFNAETGLTTAMLKKYMGNDNTFNRVIKNWLKRTGQYNPPVVPALPTPKYEVICDLPEAAIPAALPAPEAQEISETAK